MVTRPIGYVLDANGEPEPLYGRSDEDYVQLEWCLSEDERRFVRRQQWVRSGREYVVSTVFLVINHAFDDGLPVLWETMAWVNDAEGVVRRELPVKQRYRSRDDAIRGHNTVVRRLKGPVLE